MALLLNNEEVRCVKALLSFLNSDTWSQMNRAELGRFAVVAGLDPRGTGTFASKCLQLGIGSDAAYPSPKNGIDVTRTPSAGQPFARKL